MTTSNPNNPGSPANPAPEPVLTPAQANDLHMRKSLALYLHQLAGLIESGAVDAFELMWHAKSGSPRPIGPVVFDARFIHSPEPDMSAILARLNNPQNIAQQPQQAPIPVETLEKTSQEPIERLCLDPKCKRCQAARLICLRPAS